MRRNRCRSFFTLAASLSATAALAQGGPGSSAIKISGYAPPGCSLPAPRATATENSTFSQNAVNISDFTDATALTLRKSRTVLIYPGTLCNYNAKLSIVSSFGGLQVAAGAPDTVQGSVSFLRKAPYTITARWGSVIAALDTGANSAAGATSVVDTGGANMADMEVTIATEDGNAPLLTGRFEDTVTIKVGAVP